MAKLRVNFIDFRRCIGRYGINFWFFWVATALLCHAQSLKVSSVPLTYPGLTLITPADPAFDKEVHGIVGDKARMVEQLSPYLLILKNSTARTIVAYTAVWTLHSGNGQNSANGPLSVRYLYPMAVVNPTGKADVTRNEEILPGEERLVSTDFELGSRANKPHAEENFSSLLRQHQREFADVVSVRISVDTIIFDDGEVVGQDRTGLGKVLRESVEIYQSLYRQIVAI